MTTKDFLQLQKIYSNLEISDDGETAILPLTSQIEVRCFAGKPVNEWEFFNHRTKSVINSKSMSEQMIATRDDIEGVWKSIVGETVDPLDNLKAGEFEIPEEPVISEPVKMPISGNASSASTKTVVPDKNVKWSTQQPKRSEVIQDAKFEEVGTQEVVTLPAPVGIGGIVRPAVSAQQALAAWREFQDLKKFIIEPSDIQVIQGKNFVKKSGWRKFATFYNLTDLIVEEKQVQMENGGYYWKIKVMCTAPNGRQTEGVGICSSTEKKFAHPEHDIYATAHTRSKNRAISDMIAAGDVSAEEVE